MRIFSIVKFLTCLAFVIFPKGCDAQVCSLSEKYRCDEDYTRKTLGHAFSCSAAEDYLDCLDKVHTACESHPGVVNSTLVINKAGTTIDEMENNRKRYGCIQVLVNGAHGRDTSLLTTALGMLCPFLILQSTALWKEYF